MASNPITRIIITAKDEASSVFSALGAHAGKIAAAIASYFSIRLFGDVVGSARDFETAMSAVQAAAGASGEELAALRAAAEDAGTTTKYTSVEAAGALENLAKAGLSATDAVQALPAVLDLAAAGGVSLGEASDYISKAVFGMGLSFEEAGRVADVLSMGANASNTSVQGLAQALSYAAPLANSLGLSLEQTVAIIGKFADAGIDASRAGTALNSILAQFSNPASKFRRELAAAGITTTDFDEALRQLAAAGAGGQRAINAVGTEAGPALRALLNQGIGSLDDLKRQLDQSAGSARDFAAVMSDNLDGATKGLGSAWDALKIKLGTPVLATLKEQVDAVAERLRQFVSDGTADRFGQAIKSAFEAGGKWVADFFSKIDFSKLAADMQAFGTRAGEVFDWIGTKATAAGNIAQTAYGVMSAGINTVLTAVYALGRGASWLASAFLSDLALIAEGISKVTFGDMSASFAAAAENLRFNAQAAYAVSEAFASKTREAFDAAAEGAELAQAGFAGLTGAANTAAAGTTAALGSIAEQAKTTAERIAELTAEQQRLTAEGDIEGATAVWREITKLSAEAAAAAKNSGEKQRAEVAATVSSLADLKKAYQSAIAAGDTQRAAELQQQIRAELKKTAGQADDTGDALEAAFQGLGITSEAELKRLAENAKAHFTTIKNSGQATTNDINAAFRVYAEAAIRANGGVADAALKAQAAQHGLRIEADAAGKAIVVAMTKGAAATAALGGEAKKTAAEIDDIGRAANDAADALNGMNGAGAGGGQGAQSYNKVSFFGVEQMLARAESLGGLKLRKEIEAEIDARAKVPRGGSSGFGGYAAIVRDLEQRLDAMQIAQEEASGKYESNKPQVTGTSQRNATTVYRVEIGTGAGHKTAINTADQSSADALVDLLRQLEADMARS